MRLCIGQAALMGKLSRYAQSFNLLELRADVGTLPRPPRLREWKALVADDFVFSVLSPKALMNLEPGEGYDKALAYAQRAVASLEAEWFVIQTGPGVTPSARGRERLAKLVGEVKSWGVRVAWEARGPWSPSQAAEFCASSGVTLVTDLGLESTSGPVIYPRVGAIGAGGRITSGAADRIAERLERAEEAFVVVEGASAKALALGLRQELLSDTSAWADFDGVEVDDQDDEELDAAGEEE
ncbi:MAG: DUF72 domain-containing protein [Myxococcales bacterium]|nr:DUF72 domain-containing protein [Myxococcales bacterium]